MKLTISSLLAYIASWGGTIGLVWFLFEKVDETINQDTKDTIARWLKNFGPVGKLGNWPAQFVAVFDNIFGERHLSWKCFCRSCFASAVSALILFFLWKSANPYEFNFYARKDIFFYSAVWASIFTMFLNFIPDYFSLLESRYILRLMCAKKSTSKIFALLAIDLVATTIIWIIGLILFLKFGRMLQSIIFSFRFSEFANLVFLPDVEYLPLIIKDAILFSRPDTAGSFSLVGIYFYTTFFTSLWVWLYALSGFFVKVLGYLGTRIYSLTTVLDIDNKPLHSMGLISMIFVTIFYLVLPILTKIL